MVDVVGKFGGEKIAPVGLRPQHCARSDGHNKALTTPSVTELSRKEEGKC